MNESVLDWLSAYYEPVVVLVTASICFPLSWYGASNSVFRAILKRRGFDRKSQEVYSVMLMRFAGAIILGGIPYLVMKLFLGGDAGDYGVTLDNFGFSLLAVLAGVVVLAPLGLLINRYWPVLFTGYPVMKIKCWDRKLVWMNTLSWIVYLAGYEFMFRGFLLFTLTEAFGSWPAIFVVTAIYTYSHLPEYWSNAVGAFSIGPYFGAVTLLTNSIFASYLLHCFIACGTAILAIKSNPETFYSKKCPP